MDINEILTIEDIRFLKQLAHQLKNQDTRGTAKPVIYNIAYMNDSGERELKNAFLTLNAAEEHLKENSHHYNKNAHTYVSCAWRNTELEKLIKILEKFDLEELI